MANIVVVGAQWGDEAKGKIVDYLAAHSSMVVRYGGGANAGQKIWIAEGHDERDALKLDSLRPGHALPDSGIEREKVLPALYRYLQDRQDAIASFDFPFARSRSLGHRSHLSLWAGFARKRGGRLWP